jgi:CBS domain-containing protein
MTTVQQLLETKGDTVLAISPETTVFEAIRTMATNDIGALVILDEGVLVGLFTERNYTRNVVLKGRSSPTTPVRDVMTVDVVTATPDDTVAACMGAMTDKRVRHLPVVDDRRKVIGIVSIGDLVKSVIAE